MHPQALLFDIWDRHLDGVICEEDMLSLARASKGKVSVQFGNEEAWKRVKNMGFVSVQNFEQFFDWFVLSPTVEAICDHAEKKSGIKSKQGNQQRKMSKVARIQRKRRSIQQQRSAALTEARGPQRAVKAMNRMRNRWKRRSIITSQARTNSASVAKERATKAKSGARRRQNAFKKLISSVDNRGAEGNLPPQKTAQSNRAKREMFARSTYRSRQGSTYKSTGARLPSGWTEFFDKATSTPYYHHHATGRSVWSVEETRPVEAGRGGEAKTEQASLRKAAVGLDRVV